MKLVARASATNDWIAIGVERLCRKPKSTTIHIQVGMGQSKCEGAGESGSWFIILYVCDSGEKVGETRAKSRIEYEVPPSLKHESLLLNDSYNSQT